MSLSKDLFLTFLMFNAVYLLVPFFLLQVCWLFGTAIWTGLPLEQLLQDICVVEDDISLPRPPGSFDSANDSIFPSGDYSTVIDASAVDSSIGSNTSSQMPYAESSIMLGYKEDHDCLGGLFSEHGSGGVIVKNVVEIAKDGVHTALVPSVPSVLSVPGVLESFDSIRSLDVTEQHFSTVPILIQQPASPQPAEQPSQELDDIDLAEGESVLCHPFSRLDLSSVQPVTIPRALEETPIFSRRNITDKVIFPVRKHSLRPQIKRDSVMGSEGTSVLKRFSATWSWTKADGQRRDLAGAMRSTLTGIRNSKIFNREEESTTIERDPYDSWPYIRTAIEQDIKEALEKEEEDLFVAGLKRPW